MSTLNPPSGPLPLGTPRDATRDTPGELRAPQGQLPLPEHALAVPTPPLSPGVGLAAAAIPGAPTLPGWDPSALTGLVAKLANDLFRAPASGASLPSEIAQLPSSSAPIPSTRAPIPSTRAPIPSTRAPVSSASAPLPHVSEPSHSARAPLSQGAALPSASAPPAPATPELVSSSATPPHSAPKSHAPASTFTDAPATTASTQSSPFESPLNFELLFTEGPLPSLRPDALFSFPLLDTIAPAPLEQTAAPSADEPRFSDHELRFSDYELVPTREFSLPATPAPFDPVALRREFPVLEERIHGRRLVWLDNAATTQKPRAVIERVKQFYERENSNVHRAAHTLAARATDAYEGARETVRRFVNASSTREIIFVRGATEGINLVAQSWGRRNVAAGDEIVITWLEHHANIVPWQQLCAEKGARLRVAPVDDRGQIILDEYEKLLGPKTRLVSLTQVSNALGTITPAREMVQLAHRHGAKVLVDGAQAVSHLHTDVQLLDCDFFVFSGHKVFAPTGIGVVFGKSAVLEAMPPWQGGGNMIEDVTFERTRYQPPPARFEAGTGNIADAVGLGTALDWLARIGLANVERYEHELLEYATERLHDVPGLQLYGTAPEKAGVLSFTLAGQKTQEVGALLDREGIAVRSGHHCAQPILRRFGVEATVRASLAPYNTCEDIDALVAALQRLQVGR